MSNIDSHNTSHYYCIESEQHPYLNNLGLCSMVEHQSLVDVVLCCGSNVLHAHKLVLAVNSSFFREEFERNANIEQIIITGCEFSVVKSIVELMYCGTTKIHEDNVKYLFAAAKTFGMKILDGLAADLPFLGDILALPKPQFLTKKPKYPAYPFVFNSGPMNPMRLANPSNLYRPQKFKRKFRIEAEHQACEKEAQASRLAIATLKKEIASSPKANTFIIEESCTETTVENFIPASGDQNFIEVDYHSVLGGTFIAQSEKDDVIQLSLPENPEELTADKIQTLLRNDTNPNVEIMYKTNDGNFVTVTDEVLQNLQKDSLQYQVIDENGKVGEIQELQLAQKNSDAVNSINVTMENNFVPMTISQGVFQQPSDLSTPDPLNKTFGILNLMENKHIEETSSENYYEDSTSSLKSEIEFVDDKTALAETLNLNKDKFFPDMFFADDTDNCEPVEKKMCP